MSSNPSLAAPKLFYVIMSAGVPVDVTHLAAQAKQRAAELESRNRPVQVIPVAPIQQEFMFEEETLEEMVHTRGVSEDVLQELAIGDTYVGHNSSECNCAECEYIRMEEGLHGEG